MCRDSEKKMENFTLGKGKCTLSRPPFFSIYPGLESEGELKSQDGEQVSSAQLFLIPLAKPQLLSECLFCIAPDYRFACRFLSLPLQINSQQLLILYYVTSVVPDLVHTTVNYPLLHLLWTSQFLRAICLQLESHWHTLTEAHTCTHVHTHRDNTVWWQTYFWIGLPLYKSTWKFYISPLLDGAKHCPQNPVLEEQVTCFLHSTNCGVNNHVIIHSKSW